MPFDSMAQDCTIGRWLCDRARATPGRVAVVHGDRAVTYHALHAASHHAADALRHLAPGDRVAVLAANCPEYVVVLFGCALRGLVVVPLNWRQSAPELAYQIGHSAAALVVHDDAHASLATEALHAAASPARRGEISIVASMTPAGCGPNTSRRTTSQCGDQPGGVEDGSPLFIVYTSGTTGRPKGAVLSHANVFWSNLAFDHLADVGSEDVVLQVLPQFHIGGWNCQPLLAWWKGATVVLEHTFDAERSLRLIADRRITTMMGVPAHYQFMAASHAFEPADLSSLRYVLVGGAPMPESLLRRWQDRGVRILQGYGLTEAAPNVLCLPSEEASRHLGYAGVPYPHVQVQLADPESGVPIEGAGSGELLVRGPSVFSGYWNDPAATAQAMRDGWLHTGDVAERDAEGFYRIKDRLKDMYISGGENVYPAEVETVLASHPSIAEAAVVAVPDERWGEAGLAAVVVRPGSSVTADEVRDWCARRLGRYKVPRDVRFLETLPRSAVGKVAKDALRERFVRGEPG